jgi:predicted nucleic acid-binding protein
MALVLFDTNILIDALKGYKAAFDELVYWDEPAISAITWMELYAGAKPDEVPKLREFISGFAFEIIHTDDSIMTRAANLRADSIRKGPKIALPDAIIMATAVSKNIMLITRNKKDFKGPNVRIPYELETATTVTVVNVIPPALTDPASMPFPTAPDDLPRKGGRPTFKRLR